ncbi:MAG: HAMP domain-containing protein, partial [Oscillochloris sp.]|nr:HAMP domain-containing protein [Oscillochloris sp.]
MIRPRIFSLMLLSFALVIILGVGGMLIFFGLTVANFEDHTASWEVVSQAVVRDEARQLRTYYERHGSWDGVEERFSGFSRKLSLPSWQVVTLVNDRGQVLASTEVDQPSVVLSFPTVSPAIVGPAMSMPPMPQHLATATEGSFTQTLPISSDGRMVGTLLISYDSGQVASSESRFDGKRVLKGFASAGLALATILLFLATFFSRRISQPMAQLTRAAQALAGGDMSVRVRPSPLREVGELAVAFNSMAESLVQADQQRRQLTADVAHELRTPLSIIKGRLEGIQDGVYVPDSPQIAGLLGEVALLERLIDDLRLLALAEAGQLLLYPEPVDPAQLLYDAERSFAQYAANREVMLRIVADDTLPEINVDPQRIAQVLSNLVGNALRHTPAGGVVTLSAKRIDGALQIAGTGSQSVSR